MKFRPAHPSVLIFALLLAASSCVYQNEEVLYPEPPPSEEPDPDPVDTCGLPVVVSYQTHVLPLLEKHYCVACHETSDPAGGITLEGYGRVTPYIEDGSLLGSIRHETGFESMPRDYPRMPDCEVELIAKWIAEGYPNN